MKAVEYLRLGMRFRVDPFYSKYLAGRRVLDIGSGAGDFVARDPSRFVGVDVDPNMVGQCRARGLDVRIGHTDRLEFPDGSFEAVHAAQLVEHLDPRQAVAMLKEAARVLVPGGVVVLTTPGVRIVWNTFSHIRPYPPDAFKKLLVSPTEGYLRTQPIDLEFVGGWGTRRYLRNRVLHFVLSFIDVVLPPKAPIGWTIVLRKPQT